MPTLNRVQTSNVRKCLILTVRWIVGINFFLDILHQLLDRNRKTRVKSPNTKNAVYDGIKPFIAKKCEKICVKNCRFLSQFCKICKTNNTVAWSTPFRIF
ncbi:hypothetical protein T4E_7868 [Trichinella pseudospiralis]|uniref:Uncharacterized protein n=1 Tax=Trichinella pseudospiralis TaxID=6337 RepID=A0A0V0XJ45_TRIPS|nr:hypothetical protein T4E_7868 [Trichinella pseudospiralis]